MHRAVEAVDRRTVVEVDQGGADKRSQDLRCPVGRNLAPREAAPHRLSQRDRRVQVSAAHPRPPTPRRPRQIPSPMRSAASRPARRMLLAAARLAERGDRPRHHAVSERDDDHRAQEFRQRLAQGGLLLAPASPRTDRGSPPFLNATADIPSARTGKPIRRTERSWLRYAIPRATHSRCSCSIASAVLVGSASRAAAAARRSRIVTARASKAKRPSQRTAARS
jgi:hypothetical protein